MNSNGYRNPGMPQNYPQPMIVGTPNQHPQHNFSQPYSHGQEYDASTAAYPPPSVAQVQFRQPYPPGPRFMSAGSTDFSTNPVPPAPSHEKMDFTITPPHRQTRYSSGPVRYYQAGQQNVGMGKKRKSVSTPKKPAEFRPPKVQIKPIFCEVCRVSCAGPTAFSEHENGQKHKKQLSKKPQPTETTNSAAETVPAAGTANQPLPNGEWNCALCQVNCSGTQSYVAHLNGKAHIKKLRLCQSMQVEVPEIATPAVIVDPALPPDSKLVKDGSVAVSRKKSNSLVEPSDTTDPTEPSKEEGTATVDTATKSAAPGPEYLIEIPPVSGKKGPHYKCTLCECTFTCVLQRDTHLIGKRHLATYRRKIDATYGVPPPQVRTKAVRSSTKASPILSSMYSYGTLGFAGLNGRGPSFMVDQTDNRTIMSKHASITPPVSELRFIRQVVGNCEQALKTISKDFVHPSTDDGGADQQSSAKRLLRGTHRVGPLGQRLLLKDEGFGEMVLLCSDWPTSDMTQTIAERLETCLETIDDSVSHMATLDASKGFIDVECTRNQTDEKNDTPDSDGKSSPSVPSDPTDKPSQFIVRIRLSSRAVQETPQDTPMADVDKESSVQTEKKSVTGDQSTSQDGRIPRDICLEALKLIDQANQFQSVGSIYPLAMVARVLRSFMCTNQEWSKLDSFTVLALLDRLLSVEYNLIARVSRGIVHTPAAYSTQMPQVQPSRLLRGFFEMLASGLGKLHPPGSSSHPITQLLSTVGDYDQIMESITFYAQRIVRLIAAGQLNKVLCLERSSNKEEEEQFSLSKEEDIEGATPLKRARNSIPATTGPIPVAAIQK